MRHGRRALTIFLSVALFAAVAVAAEKAVVASLKFNPQEGVYSETPAFVEGFTDKTVTLKVVDGRGKDPSVIGEGTDGKDRAFPIQTTDDVPAFAGQVLEKIAEQWGLKSQKGGDRLLTVKLTKFMVTESNKALGSMYSGDVTLSYTLTDSKGRTLDTGTVSGDTKRYGRARSKDNYNEVLSDALKEAYFNMFDDDAMQTAWASGKAKK